MDILNLLLGGAGGGIIGTVGSFAMKWQEGKQAIELKKIENAHEVAMSEREESLLKMKLNNEERIKEIDRSIVVEQGSLAAFQASLESDRATYSVVDSSKTSAWLICVDVIRGLMRPGLTIGLASLNGYMTLVLLSQLQDKTEIATTIATSTATLAGMAISWWFGARPHGAKA